MTILLHPSEQHTLGSKTTPLGLTEREIILIASFNEFFLVKKYRARKTKGNTSFFYFYYLYHFTRQNINIQATTIGMQGLKDKFGCTDMPGTGIFGSKL